MLCEVLYLALHFNRLALLRLDPIKGDLNKPIRTQAMPIQSAKPCCCSLKLCRAGGMEAAHENAQRHIDNLSSR
jgi:hypothetical protein